MPKGFMKLMTWALVPKKLHVTNARNSKDGITPHLYKGDTDKPLLFNEKTGEQSENQAIDYIKSKGLQNQFKQIPIYPSDEAVLKGTKSPPKTKAKDVDKIPAKKPSKAPVKSAPKKPTKAPGKTTGKKSK